MPKTNLVRIYRAKGNSDTLAVVIPKSVRDSGNYHRGDLLEASIDRVGRLVFKKTEKDIST